MCSCSDNDVDAIHSYVTWTSLLTVRLNQFHFRVGLLSLCFSMSFFTWSNCLHLWLDYQGYILLMLLKHFFRNESPVFYLDMFGFHLKLESRRLGDIKTE